MPEGSRFAPRRSAGAPLARLPLPTLDQHQRQEQEQLQVQEREHLGRGRLACPLRPEVVFPREPDAGVTVRCAGALARGPTPPTSCAARREVMLAQGVVC